MKKQKQDGVPQEGVPEPAPQEILRDDAPQEVAQNSAPPSGEEAPAMPNRKGAWGAFTNKLDAYFGVTARGSSFKREVIAGLTTFMSMVYALLVVPGMYPEAAVSFGAVYIATALGAILGTILMALLAKMPIAQASGLGATAYVTGTLIGGSMGLSYANAMVFVLFDGIIFVLLTATGLRKKILEAIPTEVKQTVPVGIGMFIAFIGFNVRPDVNAKALAAQKKIDIRFYDIIYDAIEDVSKAVKGLLEPKFRETNLGNAEIRMVYKITGVGYVAGCYVTDGKVFRNSKARLVREGTVVYNGEIASLQHGKEAVKEMARGYECGITLKNFQDLKVGDIIESYTMEQINEN